jgi:hypothetical protein
MGRPVNKRYIGNTSQSGQQIQATAYFGGATGPVTAWINRQVATNTYEMVAQDGLSSGRVQLSQGGVALQPGEANITVTPYGAGGSGAAAANANLGVGTATVATAGTGDTTHFYVPGQIIYPSSGTASQRANLTVIGVTLGSAIANAGSGPGYTVGDRFIWAHAGYDTPVVVTVASTTGNGNVNGLSYTTPGYVTNVSVTNTTPYSSSVTTNAWATGATFDVRWDVASLSITNRGDYSSAPANPVALTGSAKGTGATATVGWEVASVRVTNGGSGYQAVVVDVAGNAQALGTVNAAGSVTGITVTHPGSGYTNSAPAVTVSTLASVEYAAEIRNLTVTTFDNNNTYEWVDSTVTPTSGQAKLQTS